MRPVGDSIKFDILNENYRIYGQDWRVGSMQLRDLNCSISRVCFLITIILPFVMILACGGGGGGGGGDDSSPSSAINNAASGQNAVVGNTFAYEVPSSLSGRLAYQLISGPGGAELTSGGFLMWTPEAAGTYTFVVLIRNDQNQEELRNVSINVITPAENTAPTIAAIPSQTATANRAYTYQVDAFDLHLPLSFELTASGDGMTITSSGLITWTPSTETAGTTVSVTVKVSDVYGVASSYTFAVIVANEGPAIADIPDQTASVGGDNYVYDRVSATDSNPPITFALQNSPSGMTISADGVINWVPSEYHAGQTLPITVKATDSFGNFNTKSFNLHVLNISPAVSDIPDTTLAPGGTLSYQVVATDANTPLTYSISAAVSGLSISQTGKIAWTAGAPGEYLITVKVTDAIGGVTEKSFTATVVDQDLPEITPIADQTATVAVPLVVSVIASDSDLPLTYSFSSGAPAGMTIDGSGVIRWTPQDVNAGFDYNNVTVKVLDAYGAESTVSFNVTVDNVAPVVQNIADKTLSVSDNCSFDVEAADNNIPLTYQLIGAPHGMTIDGNGHVSYVVPSQHQGATYNVTVRVTDAHATDPLYTDELFQVTVSNIAPVFSAVPDQVTGKNALFFIDFSGFTNDPNVPLVYSIDLGATNVGGNPAPSINSSSGVISWTPDTNGAFVVGVKVTDQPGLFAIKTFNINVSDLTIVSPAALPSIGKGDYYSYGLRGSGGAKPYAWSVTVGSLPDGLTLDPADGVISGTASVEGTFNFTVQLQESGAATTTKGFSIIVIDGPVITTETLSSGNVGFAYSTTLQGSGGSLPYEWALLSGELPPGLSLNASTGIISGTPTSGGLYNCIIILADNNSVFYTKAFETTVKEAGDWQDEFNNTDKIDAFSGVNVQLGEVNISSRQQFMKAITVANPAGVDLIDHQIKLTVPPSAGKMNLDCSDLRFIDSNGNILPYWIENPFPQSPADIKFLNPGATDGVYTWNVNGAPVQAYCDMTVDGGGWSLLMNIDTQDGHPCDYWADDDFWTSSASYGNIVDALTKDYKNASWSTITGSEIMIAVHDEGSLIAWRKWPLIAERSLYSMFQVADNSILVGNSTGENNTAALNASEPVVRYAGTFKCNAYWGNSSSQDRARIKYSSAATNDDYVGGIGHDWNCQSTKASKTIWTYGAADAYLGYTHYTSPANRIIGSDYWYPSNRYSCDNPSGVNYDYAIYLRASVKPLTVWVKISDIPAVGTTIYMLYGDAKAKAASNGANTFDFFDGFDGTTIDTSIWTIEDGSSFSVSGGYLHGTNTTARITSKATFSTGVVLDIKAKTTAIATNGQMIGGFYSAPDNCIGWLNHPGNAYYRNDASWVSKPDQTPANNLLYTIIVKDAATVNMEIYNLDTVAAYWAVGDIANAVSDQPILLGRRYDSEIYNNQSYATDWDWVRIRKYVNPGPSGVFGGELPASGYYGSLVSKSVEPTSLSAWGNFSFEDFKASNGGPAGTNIKYFVEWNNAGRWELIPEGDLTDNSIGFTTSPVILSGLSSVTYPEIRLRASFTSTTLDISPTLVKWGVTWTP